MINNDSILFLLAARESLCLIAESSNMSKGNKNILTDFVINEASDYQVMSLLLDGKLPDTEINEAEEEELFKKLRVIVAANKKLVCEMFGFDVYEDVVKKINPLYPKLSTTKPVLNFHLGSGGLNSLLEAPFSVSEKKLSGAGRWQQKQSRERMRKAAEVSKKGFKVKRKIIPKAVPKAKVIPKVIKKDPLAALPPGHKGGGKRLIKPVSPAKTHRDLPMTTKKSIGKGEVLPPKSSGGITPKPKIKAQPEVKAGLGTRIAAGVGKAGKAIAGLSPAAKVVGGAAIAALALYASYKVYKRFLSKAARACGGRSGAEKTSCMKKFQISAYNAQIKNLQGASAACSKAKNPGKCKAAIAGKIDKIKMKATKAT